MKRKTAKAHIVLAIAALATLNASADSRKPQLLSELVQLDEMQAVGTPFPPSERMTIDCNAGDTLDILPIGLPVGTVGQAVGVLDGDDDDDDANKTADIGRLFVEISGVCTGNLIIRRSNVTLLGVTEDAAIVGGIDTRGNPVGSVIEVHYAQGVRVRDMTISNGFPAAIDALYSDVWVGNVVIEKNSRGFRSVGSTSEIRDSIIRGNERGISTGVGDLTISRDNVVHDNSVIGLMVQTGANLTVIGNEVYNNGIGFISMNSAVMVWFDGATLSNNGTGGWSLYQSIVRFHGLIDAGDLILHVGGNASTVIASNGVMSGKLIVDGSSDLVVEGELTGDAHITEFSRAVVQSGGRADSLTCANGGDAACAGVVIATDCNSCTPTTGLTNDLGIGALDGDPMSLNAAGLSGGIPQSIRELIEDGRP